MTYHVSSYLDVSSYADVSGPADPRSYMSPWLIQATVGCPTAIDTVVSDWDPEDSDLSVSGKWSKRFKRLGKNLEKGFKTLAPVALSVLSPGLGTMAGGLFGQGRGVSLQANAPGGSLVETGNPVEQIAERIRGFLPQDGGGQRPMGDPPITPGGGTPSSGIPPTHLAIGAAVALAGFLLLRKR